MKSPEEISAQRLIALFHKKYGTKMLSLAYHAALPVVITPELLHLIRINFFFEPDVALPYIAEIDVLFSDLCHEVDKKYGLYEFDQTIREILLKGLQDKYGTGRIREVAALLYQYSEKNSPWIERVELERAQQITALSFLNPEKAKEWFQMAEEAKQSTSGAVNEKWFVAVRKKMIIVEDLVDKESNYDRIIQEARVKLIEAVNKQWTTNPTFITGQKNKNWYISRSNDTPSLKLTAPEAFSLLHGRAVILGEPGIGKTSALIQIARDELANTSEAEQKQIPVILPLNEFPSGDITLREWIVSEISDQYQIPLVALEDLIRAHELTFLLDGLDESKSPAICVAAINEFLKIYSEVRVAVTCRTLTYSKLKNLNLNGEILPVMAKRRHPLKVFISYASGDRAEAQKLHEFLVMQGVDAWLDTENLLPGQDWKMEISRALDETDLILLCLSKKSVSREGYVQKEMRLALDRALEIPPGEIFLIPARFEECDLPYSLRDFQWVDLYTESGMQKFIKSLSLRADKVGAHQISVDGPFNIRNKKPGSNAKIDIQGNVKGSNIIIGNNNEVTNDPEKEE